MNVRRYWCSFLILVMLGAGCGDDEPAPGPDTTDTDTTDTGTPGDAEVADTGDAAVATDDAAPDTGDVTPDADDAAVDGEGDAVDGDAAPVDEIQLAPSRALTEAGFATALNCADCHSNAAQSDAMRDTSGDPIGFYDLWSASMMANAARDPLWRAAVSAETAATPAAAAEIEDKCITCHAPMAYTAVHEAGGTASLELLHETDALAMLALDGASCTTCHKIEPDNFGMESSFSGGFIINPNQIAYGPLANPFAQPMINQSGFEPLVSDHIMESEMCATCHNLTTDTLDPQGNPTGESFVEQSPFTEWQNSAYNTDGGATPASCQSCHTPQTDDEGNQISTVIARRPNGSAFPNTTTRQPVGRHVLIGGNTLVPAILRDNADALNPQAPPEAFNALIAKVRDQLQNRTARVDIASVQRTDEGIDIAVSLENLTGHKFPASFPSRRAWLHVIVRDAAGDVVFESGEWDAQGRLIGDDGQPLTIEQVGGPIEPHHTTIDSADQVQIYEPVMADSDGQPTWVLLRAAEYFKDNRLLPKGWSSSFADIDEIAPVGTDGDASFDAGGDQITYEVTLADTSGQFDVDVELVYQVLGARFAAELFTADTNPVRVFEQYYDQADTTPELVGADSAVVD